ncbi:hypothetical protein B0H10DRAFT_2447175 [Mycena sp. CBHHK59/15]|nr:hypothetical protein B0H10DRAFT_2447175 [Mycena sp. CBHHK59/15]
MSTAGPNANCASSTTSASPHGTVAQTDVQRGPGLRRHTSRRTCLHLVRSPYTQFSTKTSISIIAAAPTPRIQQSRPHSGPRSRPRTTHFLPSCLRLSTTRETTGYLSTELVWRPLHLLAPPSSVGGSRSLDNSSRLPHSRSLHRATPRCILCPRAHLRMHRRVPSSDLRDPALRCLTESPTTPRTAHISTSPIPHITSPPPPPPPRPPPRPKGIGTSVSMTQTATRAKRHVGRYHAHA